MDGEIRINGRPIDRSFCDMSGYIYQDDIFVGSLTAREHLLFTVRFSPVIQFTVDVCLCTVAVTFKQARLKMSGMWTKREQDLRVEELLTELGLIKCQNVLIGVTGVTKGLSGGERKRLSFASQVVVVVVVLLLRHRVS